MYEVILNVAKTTVCPVLYAGDNSILITYEHSWELEMGNRKRPGTRCRVYRVQKPFAPGMSERLKEAVGLAKPEQPKVEDLECLDVETIILLGKFKHKYNWKKKKMERVWIGDNFNRRNARRITIGLILHRWKLPKALRKQVQGQVS